MNSKCCCGFNYFRPIRWISSITKNRKVVIMLVGLDNAGKSCTIRRLAGAPVADVLPTVGFSSISLKHRGYVVVIYDLGGGPQIRNIWPNYYGDAHGFIFIVDASDLRRMDEARKALEEMLAHDKVAGKPILVLANKQDRDGALDEIDIVERLSLECLVNQQRCPTLVETCSATGPPAGRTLRMDPGIDNGYRWLRERIIGEYEKLNSRVERDSEEQRVAMEAARQEWLQRQDTDQQVDSLPSEYEENPFKPIHVVVKSNESNGHIPGDGMGNGHVVTVEPFSLPGSEDSPDSSSHTVGEGSEHGTYIPLHSPTEPAEPNILVVSQPQPVDVIKAVRDQFEWKMNKQKSKRKLLLRRTNRTAPASASSGSGDQLPPLRLPHSTCPWARPVTSKSLPSKGWGLHLSLDEVDPSLDLDSGDHQLRIIKTPRTLVITDSDDDDVVTATTPCN